MGNNLTYAQAGDYLLPNLILDDQPSRPLGKYGLLRKEYLRQRRSVLWGTLLITGKLFQHLIEIEDAANRRLQEILPTLMEAAGATEECKIRDPAYWSVLMDECQTQAEETILREIVYA